MNENKIDQRDTIVQYGNHSSIDSEIQLGDLDSDIVLNFPNGQQMVIQYRTENATIDICFDSLEKSIMCTNWTGDDMTPSKNLNGQPGVHQINQLCIAFPEDWISNKPDMSPTIPYYIADKSLTRKYGYTVRDANRITSYFTGPNYTGGWYKRKGDAQNRADILNEAIADTRI